MEALPSLMRSKEAFLCFNNRIIARGLDMEEVMLSVRFWYGLTKPLSEPSNFPLSSSLNLKRSFCSLNALLRLLTCARQFSCFCSRIGAQHLAFPQVFSLFSEVLISISERSYSVIFFSFLSFSFNSF